MNSVHSSSHGVPLAEVSGKSDWWYCLPKTISAEVCMFPWWNLLAVQSGLWGGAYYHQPIIDIRMLTTQWGDWHSFSMPGEPEPTSHKWIIYTLPQSLICINNPPLIASNTTLEWSWGYVSDPLKQVPGEVSGSILCLPSQMTSFYGSYSATSTPRLNYTPSPHLGTSSCHS